jgi:hypothetical protein
LNAGSNIIAASEKHLWQMIEEEKQCLENHQCGQFLFVRRWHSALAGSRTPFSQKTPMNSWIEMFPIK